MAGMKNNPLANRPLSAVERAEQALDTTPPTPVAPPRETVVAPPRAATETTPRSTPTASRTGRKSTKVIPKRKVQITAYVDRDVDEASRDAEYALRSTPDAPDNYSEFVTEALRHYTSVMANRHHGGEAFPERPARRK